MNFEPSNLLMILGLLGFLISCKNVDSNKQSGIAQKGSTNNLSDTFGEPKKRYDTISVSTSKQIVGTWEDLGKESLTVEITKDKIFYKEHNESLLFKIRFDSIYVYYPDRTLSGRPYLINDTFVIALANGNGEDKYLKLKK